MRDAIVGAKLLVEGLAIDRGQQWQERMGALAE